MTVSIALFTQDLRLHDNPALHAACTAGKDVVPLFVLDPAVASAGFATPNRSAFLADCLADLDRSLRRIGGRLIVRAGTVADEVMRVAAETGADSVHVAAGVSRFARRREARLRQRLGPRLTVHDGSLTAVPAGWITPAGKDHYAVFTPYFRAWAQAERGTPLPAPRRLSTPPSLTSAALPTARPASPRLPEGGESAGRTRWRRWSPDAYHELHDDLAADATSRLSPYLHFGCLSARELVDAATRHSGPGAEAFIRQLAWRDFHHQVLAARPAAAHADYRTRADQWHIDEEEAQAWREGRTGFPIIDAGMRQLATEGWMHNRARLLTASFLTKSLYHDWRIGAAHFLTLLVDGDIANNQLNWQWVAGTGTDTRPNRVLNPLLQADRYDPHGDYVRRWVPELAHIAGRSVHRPWLLSDRPAYPAPLIEPGALSGRIRHGRNLNGR
ncbi:cryptochrome/photolyase family protein [Kitasatospora kifunensis]|uniref:Deoxyribodipyrimidine photo-lyase n=1 Tax=Kitasatospora kifunensis TaxID=58351 RepID=A0A7W7VZI5_KITKI|nr:deoxyribodipyrimidine photo-lyase [Kitasatospora kifunensis]MBB4927735.1 deoxyribodipyrimidine photo-lyase [Kitasatospora kifunensis]